MFTFRKATRDDDGSDPHFAFHGRYAECLRLAEGARALGLDPDCAYCAVGFGSVYVRGEGDALEAAGRALAAAGLFEPDE